MTDASNRRRWDKLAAEYDDDGGDTRKQWMSKWVLCLSILTSHVVVVLHSSQHVRCLRCKNCTAGGMR